MAHEIAPDDVVRTHAEAAAQERPPLLVLEPLLAFLDREGLGAGEPEITAIGDGRSNATFLLHRGGARFVLRRPPRPPIPPSANDMLREARVQRALAGRVRVAEILAVCESPEVIGAPFYVMEEMRGEVVTTAMPAGLDTPEQRRRTGEQLVDALVELHAVDWRAAGLEGFGKPEGYLERQLRRFLGLWEHNKTREIPAVESVGTWLRDHLPQSPPSTIVHGDYRLGNVMLAAAPPAEVVAIFDWEMSTIGDPLADLGYLCLTYASRDDGDDQPFQLSKVTLDEGWPLRDELIARYEERSGRSMTDIRWYQTLALWKAIVFMEGNFKRASSGMSDDPYLKSFGDTIVEMAERAEGLTRDA
jgi:aminoglycoside phosphotransferase (APT) family kinase protein